MADTSRTAGLVSRDQFIEIRRQRLIRTKLSRDGGYTPIFILILTNVDQRQQDCAAGCEQLGQLLLKEPDVLIEIFMGCGDSVRAASLLQGTFPEEIDFLYLTPRCKYITTGGPIDSYTESVSTIYPQLDQSMLLSVTNGKSSTGVLFDLRSSKK